MEWITLDVIFRMSVNNSPVEVLTSDTIFRHVLDALAMADTDDFLTGKRVRTIRRLLYLTDEDFEVYILDADCPFDRADKRIILKFQTWVEHILKTTGKHPEFISFEITDLDDPEMSSYLSVGSVEFSPAVSSPRGVSDLHNNNEPQYSKRSISDFKGAKFPSIPISPKSMKLWKDSFFTILSAHSVDNYLKFSKDKRPSPPLDSDSMDTKRYNQDLEWIWTALKSVTLGHPAHSFVKNSDDAFSAWDTLLAHYDKEGHDQGARGAAFSQLMNKRLDSVKPGSFEHFIASFEEQCEVLRNEDTALPDLSKRDILVNSISHHSYATLKAEFQVKKHDYTTCVDMLMALSQHVEQSDPPALTKRIHNVRNPNGQGPKRVLNYEVDENGNMPKEKYLALSRDLQVKFRNERSRLRNNGVFKTPPPWKGKKNSRNSNSPKGEIDALAKKLIASLSIQPVTSTVAKTTTEVPNATSVSTNDKLTSAERAIMIKLLSSRSIKTARTVHVASRIMCLAHNNPDGLFTCTLDGGADTILA